MRVGRTFWFSFLTTDGRYKIFQMCDKRRSLIGVRRTICSTKTVYLLTIQLLFMVKDMVTAKLEN